MRNSQKIAAGILAATVVFAGAAKTPASRIEDAFLNMTASAADDLLSISNGTTVPDTIAKGKGLAVKGVVSSESSNISSVTVGIYDSSRKLVTGKSALPKSKSYNIAKLDSYIEFDKLAAGTYTYMVFATNDTSTNYVLTNKSFTVTDGTTTATPNTTDTMSISNGTTLPAAIKKGQCVTVKGIVTSTNSDMTSLTVGVYDKDGKMVTGETAAPNAKTYRVANLDSAITFNKLENGNYTYKVIATNAANKDVVIVSQDFAVTADGNAPAQNPDNTGTTTNTTPDSTPGATTDTITISGSTEVPDKLAKGKSVIVKGTVTSAESNLEALTVGIYDTQGKLVTGKTAIPNAKTYDLSKLDNYIEFNKLPDGTYAYMVFASNGVSKNYVMVNKAFTVGEGNGQAANDVMAIANGTTVPSTLAKGKGVSVKGTVASASSEITSLTVGVYDTNNKIVTGKSVMPNAKTYNLNKLDNDVLFNKLAEGDYTYKVFATNASTKDYALVEQKFTVGDKASASDLMTIANGTSVPQSLKKGSCLTVKGTVSSASSNLTSVTVGIYDSQNKLVTGKTAIPNAKTYNIGKLDSYVEFNKLTDGEYAYMVFATNAANENYVITNQKFTVGNATSSNSNTTSSNANGISFTDGTSIPESITRGRGVAVRGTINSDSTIKAVTVAIYDANNKLVTSKSVAPDASSYDLKNVDKYIEFNKLPAGSYTYRVAVTTTSTKDYTADRQVFNVK